MVVRKHKDEDRNSVMFNVMRLVTKIIKQKAGERLSYVIRRRIPENLMYLNIDIFGGFRISWS